MRRLLALLVLLLAIQLATYAVRLVGADAELVTRAVPTELQAVSRVSSGLRRAIANILWMRVDTYLHTGSKTALELPKKDDPSTIVIAASGVSAEMNMKELFPLMRLVVMLDPQFVKAGRTVGVQLIKMGKRLAGKQYIQDLILYNHDHPRVYMLYSAIGVTLWQVQAYKECRSYLRMAADLFPRVLDEKLLEKYNEPAADSNEQLIYRAILTGLVQAAVMTEDYEEGLTYWLKSGEFAPNNVYTKVLALYTKMKKEGNVDREELSYRVREWKAEDDARENEKQKTIDEERKKNPSGREPLPAKVEPGAVEHEEQGIRYLKMEKQLEVVSLVVENALWAKLGLIGLLNVVLVAVGKRKGWLAR